MVFRDKRATWKIGVATLDNEDAAAIRDAVGNETTLTLAERPLVRYP